MRTRDDRGTTIPLILGFFIIALITVAGAVAAGDAFVQQRGLQDVCDGAAAAGAASAANLDRGAALASERSLQVADVQSVVDGYLARDSGREAVHIEA
ncbi:MAG: putative Flp pilus-assembly TadE/G-like, partial [Pseudonocardiales bacterium]|nr:putative Flp pilus-assembly TadE/G-like [Pseudonocardiales bacterium]